MTEERDLEPYAWMAPGGTIWSRKGSDRDVPLYTSPPVPQGWLRAIDEEMVATHLGVADANDDYTSAKQKLHALICWHVAVAADPSVNGGWKLVPEEPTPEMLAEAAARLQEEDFAAQSELEFQADAHTAWDAMLAAAPEPPR